MRTSHRLAICALAFAACKKDNPEYCAGHPDDTVNCPPPDAGLCTRDDLCPRQVCDTSTGACVQCTPAKANACTGTTPFCGAANTCEGCSSHEQCTSSETCLPTGACAANSEVAYVSATGNGTECARPTPCPLLADAIATNRPYVKIASVAKDDAPVLIDGKTVTILAGAGATLDRDGEGPILEVKSANADVQIFDLRITGATGTSGGDGVLVTSNGGTPKLSLTRVKIDSNQGLGISVTGGALTVMQSTVYSNQGGGISSSGGAVTVTQSTVYSNQGGGISVTGTGAVFTIVNNFIYRNGDSDTGIFGGVNLGITTVGANVFEFNTVVDNRASAGSARAGGVLCDIVGFAAANNIIARNYVNNDESLTNSNTYGVCTYPTSTIATNVSGLNFVSPDTSPFDYHVTVGSAVIDGATTTSSIAVDHDDDARPQGAQKDIGADEYKP